MRALASNGFHSGSSSSKQCISSRLVHFKGTMRDDIASAVHCSDIMAHGVYIYNVRLPIIYEYVIKILECHEYLMV